MKRAQGRQHAPDAAGATDGDLVRRALARDGNALRTTTRGVHKPGTDLVIGRMLGCFRDNALTRQEFLGMAT
jgi:hypothetical protein